MCKIPLVSTVAAIALLACGGGGGMSGATGGSTGTQPTASGGAPSGSGGVSTTPADAAAGGWVGTGGATGMPPTQGSGGVPITAGTGGASGKGGVPGTGGIPGTGGSPGMGGSPGTGGTLVKGGTGGAGAAAGTGGAGGTTIKLDASSGIETGAGNDGGASGSSGCDKDLSGTWDLFATSMGTGIVSATLVISKDGFSLTTSRAQLAYNAASTKSATWKYSNYYSPTTRVIAIQNTPAAADTGSIPIAVGGHWVMQSNRETCTLDVAGDKVTGNCTVKGVSDYNVGGDDWPWGVLPSPENRVRYTLSRTAALASQFGEFGGNWTAQSDTGSGQGCSFKLDGNTATSSCRASNSFNGNLHLTVGANCVASGVTPSGLEVSARRR